jgi:hypothetical protein
VPAMKCCYVSRKEKGRVCGAMKVTHCSYALYMNVMLNFNPKNSEPRCIRYSVNVVQT